MRCRGGDGAHCLQIPPLRSVGFGEQRSPSIQEIFSAIISPTLPQNAEPNSQENPLAGQGSPLQMWKRGAFSLGKIMKEGGRLALGTPFPEVCSQRVPPPETGGKKSINPARAGRASPRLCRVLPSWRKSWKPIRKKTTRGFGGVGKSRQAANDVPVRAWCAGPRTPAPAQSPSRLTEQSKSRVPA